MVNITSKGNPKKIDIVIPVYNAYEDLYRCLDSVDKSLTSSNAGDVKVILIDDKSSDERVLPLLGKYAERESYFLIENVKNLGFTANVNKGMKLNPQRDIILLNTDTVVTQKWIKKLQKCAYSKSTIATVTPLSNNGNGICSVPNFCQKNEIPQGYSIQGFARLIEKHSLQLYPEIPTAVGFCMFIKRDVIKEIGYFDEKAFGKGYGEETDFSLRAQKNGYVNVLADDTFIYHKGSSSFTSQRSRFREKRGLKILKKKHPDFLSNWKDFCENNPLKPIHSNIYFWLKYEKSNLPDFIIRFLRFLYKVKAGLF
jgi:GT2 family glycosyltransferase